MQEQFHSQEIANNKEENALNQVFSKYLPYWPLFLLLMLIAISGSYLYLRYTTPEYAATATLIIKDENKGYEDSKMMESLNLLYAKKIIENEIEVLKSRTLMENVVKTLHLYAPVFEEGKIKSAYAYTTSPVNIEAKTPGAIKEVNKVYFKYNKNNNTVLLNNKYKFNCNEWSNTPYGVLRFKTNSKYKPGETGNVLFFSLIKPQKVAKGALSNLSVTPASKTSTIINLYLTDPVPQKGEDILNELISAYNTSAIEDKNNLAANTLTFVESRLHVISKEIDSIERHIQQYKARNGAVDISTQGQLFLQNVSSNDQKLSDVNMQMSVLDQVEKFVLSKENAGGIVPATLGVNDPVLSKLLDKLYNLELEHESLRKTVAENNPMLISVTDQIDKIKPHILDNIQSQRKGLLASKNNLYATNSTYNAILKTIPTKERHLLEISREHSILSGIYSFLLQKREESALSYASTVSDSRVVDKAQASLAPVSPNSKIIYLTSIILVICLSIGTITLKEALSRKILYRQEIAILTSFPIIGEVPFEKTSSPIVVKDGNRSFIAEAFRKIRVSLPFLGIDSKHKKILVTSSIPGEGKSFVAANLALTLALMGKKVALLDFDLINSSLGSMFDSKGAPGITEYLIGTHEPEEIIRRTTENDNLFFLPSGSTPPNPSELISSEKTKELINYLDNLFDYIVVDSAPVVPVTDAYILSAHCNTTLYIIRHKYTPKVLVKHIDENNKINPLVNPAIVFNGLRTRGFVKVSYGYGYSYNYGGSQRTKY